MGRLRADAAIAVGTAALGGLLVAAGIVIGERQGSGTLTDLVGLAASAVGLLLLAWWLVSLILAFVAGMLAQKAQTRVQRFASAAAPEYMKRIAIAVLGLNMIAIPAATASESSVTVNITTSAAAEGAESVSPLWVDSQENATLESVSPQWKPTRQPAQGGLLVKQQRAADIRQHNEVTVKPGDCLWTLAAEQLGSSATDQQIANQWQLWYSANQDVIGEDPDILLPGTVLTAPSVPQP